MDELKTFTVVAELVIQADDKEGAVKRANDDMEVLTTVEGFLDFHIVDIQETPEGV